MSDRFAVGEVAIVVSDDPRFDGTEVTVLGPLEWKKVYGWIQGDTREGFFYPVHTALLPEPPPGSHCWCPPEQLRKRRPPQDWVRICRLSERPVEEPA